MPNINDLNDEEINREFEEISDELNWYFGLKDEDYEDYEDSNEDLEDNNDEENYSDDFDDESDEESDK